ncbi:MAG: hypothetical protein NTV57_02055 [Cyanobacteria bacterium]|nr:hypothetical protein [Cyanobacteriota bacterium]
MAEGRLKPARAALAIAAFLALITVIATLSRMPYVLFPELGALGWVVFSNPRHPWARSPALLMLTPFLAALQGLLITRHLAYGPMAVLLVVGLSLLLIAALRSPIVPALSAGLLPLALDIHSWTYPFAILIGTGGLALVSLWRARRASDGVPQPAEAPPITMWSLRGRTQPLPPMRDWLWPFGLLRLLRLSFPPALGLALLPFVIPQPPLSYPLFTLAGSLWLLLVVALHEALAGPDAGGGDADGHAGAGGSSDGATGTA